MTFNAGAQPFDTKYRNRIEAFNEFNVLIVGYLALQLLYSSWSPIMMNHVGSSILITILGGIALNAFVIIWCQIKEVKMQFLHWKHKRAQKKMTTKKP